MNHHLSIEYLLMPNFDYVLEINYSTNFVVMQDMDIVVLLFENDYEILMHQYTIKEKDLHFVRD
jgi:hypothetical protein